MQAQQRDSVRTRADSLRADSLRADSLRADSVVRARADSLRQARLDSLRSDSLMREDLATIREQQRRADSIKVPTPAAEMPRLAEHPGTFQWNRSQLAATGALTLGDLLERVPGVTVLRSGWIASPEQVATVGDFGALRVFQDGIELQALDRRTGGIHDVSVIPLWPLEEVRIERGAFETRVYLQSWRVQNTTPATRVDVGTGDLQTNAYRGYFGRRFTHGEVLQVGGQQFSTRDPRGVGDGDQLSLFSRVGWARGRWGADITWLRTRRERALQPRQADYPGDDLAPIDLTNSDLTARVAWTDRPRGIWAQLLASTMRHQQTARLSSADNLSSTPVNDTIPDSTAFRDRARQYIAAAGWERNGLSLSATLRARDALGERTLSPLLRAGITWGNLVATATAEDRNEVDLRRLEALARWQPLGRLALSGAIGLTSFDDTTRDASMAFRGEAAWRIGQMWAGGGVLRRGAQLLPAPVVYDTAFRAVTDAAAMGYFANIRGKFWRDVGAEVTAVDWGTPGPYRPRYEARTRLYIDTDMRQRFPSGNLNILFALTHEYRSGVPFPVGAGANAALVDGSQFRLIGFLLEIRLLQATLSYQFRNFLNEQFAQVPGFANARPVQFYGVRWNFFN